MNRMACFALGLFAMLPAPAAFEKVALMDSFDFVHFIETETGKGNDQLVDYVLKSGATHIWWRNQGGGVPRYPSKECDLRFLPSPLDKLRVSWNDRYGWTRLERGQDVEDLFGDALAKIRARGIGAGIHFSYEENHNCNILFEPWNLQHPQYWVRTYEGVPYAGRCSTAYDAVLEHRMRLLDELIAYNPETLFFDMVRIGWWTPAEEYVDVVCDEYRKLYGENPPADSKDPRWLKLVGTYVVRYLKAIRARCDAAPKRPKLILGIGRIHPDAEAEDRAFYEQWGFNWKDLAKEGVFDGVGVMGVLPEGGDPFGATERGYRHVKAAIGAGDFYGHCSMYNQLECGIPGAMKLTGLGDAEVARRFLEIAKRCGAKGVLLECVDYDLYSAAVSNVIKEFK